MALGLNKVMLIGNLGKDAETRRTQNGTAVTSFSIATGFRTKDPSTGDWREESEWHNIVLWDAERVAEYLRKGTQVFVEGRLKTSKYQDKSGVDRWKTEVVCSRGGIQLLGSRGGGGSSSGSNWGNQPRGDYSPAPSVSVSTPKQTSSSEYRNDDSYSQDSDSGGRDTRVDDESDDLPF